MGNRMTDATESTGRNSLGGPRSPVLGPLRLIIGLLQGFALYWLYQTADYEPYLWPATVPELFGPLALILVMVPVLMLAGVGRMRWTTLLLWALSATAFLALLGWHNVVSQATSAGYGPREHPPFLNMPMPLFAAAALFIGHHLVLGADMERRWIAAFPTYFDTAWKAGVQLALSIGFTGAFWILLVLGAALFHVIGLDFLQDLLGEEWFAIPATTFVFSVAVHLTDVRDGLIRGVRTVALMLLSWLLTVITVLVAGFLIALPFTGLGGLWETGSATALVLAAAAVLIVLINTAYQDGRADNLPPTVLRATVRLAAVLITPLIIIAFWGLALRIGQHGLTPERIIAFACAVVGAAYAIGYGWAALSPFWRKGAGWMKPLELTNVATAVLEIAVVLALFSPLLDPARLSVADQVARLERGAVTPAQFDFRFLRFDSGKAGEAALTRLLRSGNPEIARRAANARDVRHRWQDKDIGQPSRMPTVEVAPVGATLPAGFLVSVPPTDDRADCVDPGQCVASAMDVNGDGRPEVLIASDHDIQLWALGEEGAWANRGAWRPRYCRGQRPQLVDPRTALRQGEVRPVAPQWPELSISGKRTTGLNPTEPCLDQGGGGD
jgi:hypothetical protein